MHIEHAEQSHQQDTGHDRQKLSPDTCQSQYQYLHRVNKPIYNGSTLCLNGTVVWTCDHKMVDLDSQRETAA